MGKEWVTEKRGKRENALKKGTVHKLHEFTRIKRGYGKEWVAEKRGKRENALKKWEEMGTRKKMDKTEGQRHREIFRRIKRGFPQIYAEKNADLRR